MYAEAAQRHAKIAAWLDDDHSRTLADAAKHFGVSINTVRNAHYRFGENRQVRVSRWSPTGKDNAKSAARIIGKVCAGVQMKDAAEAEGISRQRAHQIVSEARKYGLPA